MSQPGHAPPPPALLMQLITGKWATHAVATAAELKLADHLKDGAKSSDDLAKATNTHGPTLYRLMRTLSMLGVFAEESGKKFSLTPVGSCLRSDVPGSLAQMAIFQAGGWHSQAWTGLTETVRTGEPAFPKVHGQHMFEWFDKHPAEAALFNGAMTSFSGVTAEAVAKTYDFSSFKKIADIAGGHGFLLSTILKANPNAKGVLFEMPQAAEGAKKLLGEAGLASRCEVVSGDFAKSVPSGCDCYMMKHIVHDWNDDACVTLLKHCVAGLARSPESGGRVLVIEGMVSSPGVPDFSKMLDLEMAVMTPGGKERTEVEYKELFARAGLRLNRVLPTQSPVSIIEGVPAT